MWPILAAILPFLGKAAAGLLAAGKTAAGTILPSVLSSAASGLLGGGQQSQTGQTGQSSLMQQPMQQPAQAPQNLFEYQPRNISLALQKMLQQSRGF